MQQAMSTSITSANLQSTIPKLAPNGSNWILYKSRVYATLIGKGLGRHLEGQILPPPDPPKFPDGRKLTDDKHKAIEDALARIDEYRTKEYEGINIILASIPESVHIKILSMTTLKEVWDSICKDHED